MTTPAAKGTQTTHFHLAPRLQTQRMCFGLLEFKSLEIVLKKGDELIPVIDRTIQLSSALNSFTPFKQTKIKIPTEPNSYLVDLSSFQSYLEELGTYTSLEDLQNATPIDCSERIKNAVIHYLNFKPADANHPFFAFSSSMKGPQTKVTPIATKRWLLQEQYVTKKRLKSSVEQRLLLLQAIENSLEEQHRRMPYKAVWVSTN